jgi:hypothetical protein
MCQLRKEPGVDAESSRRRTRRMSVRERERERERAQASAAALRLLLAQLHRPLPSPASNSFPSPTPRRARAHPRPNPPPPARQLQARTPNPERNYPGGQGVYRHLEQRRKGKESHKAGRLGSRGLVSLAPHPLAKCVCGWQAASLRTCWARRTAARAACARPGRPEVASVSRTQPSPLQGRRLHNTHTHTHKPARPGGGGPAPPRPRAPAPRCPAALPSCSAPAAEPAPNLMPGRPAEPL